MSHYLMETNGKDIFHLERVSRLNSLRQEILGYEEIISKDREAKLKIVRQAWEGYLSELKQFEVTERRPVSLDISGSSVNIGRDDDVTGKDRTTVDQMIDKLIPWRKGPIELYGTKIDTEWISSMKWDRIEPLLKNLQGKRVADVGCGNGYYMFRALKFNPELIIGFDPFERYFLQYDLLARQLTPLPIEFLLQGSDALSHFPKCFDVVLCMGVIYHSRDPLRLLKQLKDALKPGGLVIVESQSIPGDEPVALSPPDRYANAHNVYFVPTKSCLTGWMKRAGFKDVQVTSFVRTTPSEQRTTHFSPGGSLKEGLDPADELRTVEGLPAPWRVCCAGIV